MNKPMNKLKLVYSAIAFYGTILLFFMWLLCVAPILDVGDTYLALILTISLLICVFINIKIYDEDTYNKILPKWFDD